MITVIEAPNSYDLNVADLTDNTIEDPITVFLAGGIVNCPDWQNVVIEKLRAYDKKHSLGNLFIFNPRRKNFPIKDKSAAKKQIEWEFNALEDSDIFSMWFCNAPSDQPICMYELGRHLCTSDLVALGVEPGYKREQDVYIQTSLVDDSIEISKTLNEHVKKIISHISLVRKLR